MSARSNVDNDLLMLPPKPNKNFKVDASPPKKETSVEVDQKNAKLGIHGRTSPLDNEKKQKAIIKQEASVSLINDLVRLLNEAVESTNFSDLEITLRLKNKKDEKSNEERTQYLHAAVFFARSKWFREEFKNPELDVFKRVHDGIDIQYKISSIDINDRKIEFKYVNLSHFQEFVKFLYSTKCKITDENKLEILKYAGAFKIPDLEKQVLKFTLNELEKGRSIIDAIEAIQVAEDFNIVELKSKCIEIINEKKKAVILTQNWEDLCDNRSKLAADILKAI